jgi:hypothetical protein
MYFTLLFAEGCVNSVHCISCVMYFDLLGFSDRMAIDSSVLLTNIQSDIFYQARILRLLKNTHSQLL